MGRYTVHLVGEASYQAAIAKVSKGDRVTIEPEPDNPYDPRALRCADVTGETIGYIERDSWLTRAIIDQKTPVTARIEEIIGGVKGKPTRGVVLTVLTGADARPAGAANKPASKVAANAVPQPGTDAQPKKRVGCLKAVVIGMAGLFGISVISAIINPPPKTPAAPAGSTPTPSPAPKPTPDQAAIKAAEKRKAGFHCLSSWDGSHRDLVRALKLTLRDPDSFEHIETKITPVNSKGEHGLIMNYRARNGFGGMNVGSLLASVKNSDCSFTIIANESG